MPQRHGPDTFFNFPGCSAAVSLNILYFFLLISLLLEFIWCSVSLFFLDCINNLNKNDKNHIVCIYGSFILVLGRGWRQSCYAVLAGFSLQLSRLSFPEAACGSASPCVLPLCVTGQCCRACSDSLALSGKACSGATLPAPSGKWSPAKL